MVCALRFRGGFRNIFDATSIAARQAKFEQGEHGEICEEQMAGFLQEQPVGLKRLLASL